MLESSSSSVSAHLGATVQPSLMMSSEAAHPLHHLPLETPTEHENLLHACGHIMATGLVEQFGWMFYYVKPNSSLFGNVDDVPNYEVQVRGSAFGEKMISYFTPIFPSLTRSSPSSAC